MSGKYSNSENVLSAKLYILNDDPDVVKKALQKQADDGARLIKEFRKERFAYLDEPLVKNFHSTLKKWNDYNLTLLEASFVDRKIISDYMGSAGINIAFTTLSDRADRLDNTFVDKVNGLESIIARLHLFDKADREPKIKAVRTDNVGSKVFIVHGHDEAAKLAVASLLKKLGIEPIILNELENKGRTTIEKLEQESCDTGFAIVLLTPDDRGKSASDKQLVFRSRQNVILELGYFIAKLGRPRVCALYKENVDLPSDFDGVLYTQFDKAGAWQIKLAQELKAAKFHVDLNNLIDRK